MNYGDNASEGSWMIRMTLQIWCLQCLIWVFYEFFMDEFGNDHSNIVPIWCRGRTQLCYAWWYLLRSLECKLATQFWLPLISLLSESRCSSMYLVRLIMDNEGVDALWLQGAQNVRLPPFLFIWMRMMPTSVTHWVAKEPTSIAGHHLMTILGSTLIMIKRYP